MPIGAGCGTQRRAASQKYVDARPTATQRAARPRVDLVSGALPRVDVLAAHERHETRELHLDACTVDRPERPLRIVLAEVEVLDAGLADHPRATELDPVVRPRPERSGGVLLRVVGLVEHIGVDAHLGAGEHRREADRTEAETCGVFGLRHVLRTRGRGDGEKNGHRHRSRE